MSEWLTIPQGVADYLKIGRRKVSEIVNSGELKTFPLFKGSIERVTTSDVCDALRESWRRKESGEDTVQLSVVPPWQVPWAERIGSPTNKSVR